jgi:hypothetical protein
MQDANNNFKKSESPKVNQLYNNLLLHFNFIVNSIQGRRPGGGEIASDPHLYDKAPTWEREPKIELILKLVRAFFKLRAPYSTAPHAASSGPVGCQTLVMMSSGAPFPPENICPGPANLLSGPDSISIILIGHSIYYTQSTFERCCLV